MLLKASKGAQSALSLCVVSHVNNNDGVSCAGDDPLVGIC